MAADDPIKRPDTAIASEGVASLAGPGLTEADWKHLATLPGLLLWTAPTHSQGEGLPSWYIYTGQDQGAPDGHEWLEAIHPEDRPQVEAVWALAQTSPGPFVSAFRLRRASGAYQPITLSATPVFDAAGVVCEWVGWGVENHALRVIDSGTDHPADRVALAIDRTRLYEEAEQARTEVALSAQQLETIFEALVDGLVVFDGQGNLLQMNMAARALLGQERQSEYSLAWAALRPSPFHLRNEQGHPLTQEQWPITKILQGEVLKGLGAVDVQLMSQDGHERQISVSGAPVRDQYGKIAGAVAVLHDVTERRKLTRQTHEALEAVLEMAEALVTGPDAPDMPLEALNGEAGPVARQLAELTCRVLGCARVGISRLDLETDLLLPLAVAGLSPEQEKRWWREQEQQQVPLHASPEPGMVAQLEAGEVLQFDLTQPPYQNQPNPYGVTTMLIVPLRIEERLLGLLSLDHAGLAHVYTPDEERLALAVARLTALVIERERLLRERAEAESRALALQEANQRLETFISIVSHELRTPVTSLKANLQIVLRRVRQGKDAAESVDRLSKQLDLLERMEHQMRRLTRLLDDVIDLARIRTGKLEIEGEACNLGKLLADIVRTEQAAYPGRTIRLEPLPEAEVTVLVDPDRVEQVITNYLTNALKYSSAQQPVEVGLTVDQDKARVWVRDQGPGISPAEQQHIWELFHRVPGIEVQSGSGVGLGLGLHISKSLIERHGGQVGVESMPGVGSTFWFTLSLASADHKQA